MCQLTHGRLDASAPTQSEREMNSPFAHGQLDENVSMQSEHEMKSQSYEIIYLQQHELT